MKWLCVNCVNVLLLVVLSVRADWTYDSRDAEVVKKVIKQCTATGAKYSCLAEKVAIAMERAIDWDIPLFNGLTLVRNERKFDNVTSARSFSGIQRLTNAVARFLDAHTLSVDFSRPSEDEDDDDGVEEGRKAKSARGGGEASATGVGGASALGSAMGGGGSGLEAVGGVESGFEDLGGKKKQKHKKGKGDKKYMNYAMMVMMGIFGITGPLIMKTLAIIAGKALIASKIALIIVGSVALKKIFEKDHTDRATVKVHTIHEHLEDDHDRVFNYNPATQNYLKTMY